MTPTQQTYIAAIKALNDATYAALRAARDTTELPMINRQLLREMARDSDALVDAGLDTAKGGAA
jgi:CRP-like cAMP-binding protein